MTTFIIVDILIPHASITPVRYIIDLFMNALIKIDFIYDISVITEQARIQYSDDTYIVQFVIKTTGKYKPTRELSIVADEIDRIIPDTCKIEQIRASEV